MKPCQSLHLLFFSKLLTWALQLKIVTNLQNCKMVKIMYFCGRECYISPKIKLDFYKWQNGFGAPSSPITWAYTVALSKFRVSAILIQLNSHPNKGNMPLLPTCKHWQIPAPSSLKKFYSPLGCKWPLLPRLQGK